MNHGAACGGDTARLASRWRDMADPSFVIPSGARNLIAGLVGISIGKLGDPSLRSG
jgi:hypothetical protein